MYNGYVCLHICVWLVSGVTCIIFHCSPLTTSTSKSSKKLLKASICLRLSIFLMLNWVPTESRIMFPHILSIICLKLTKNCWRLENFKKPGPVLVMRVPAVLPLAPVVGAPVQAWWAATSQGPGLFHDLDLHPNLSPLLRQNQQIHDVANSRHPAYLSTSHSSSSQM